MNIKRIGLRFNLEKEVDRRAWEYLQQAKKSYSKSVISVINGYHANLSEEKRQSAFLERVIQTIEQTIKATAPASTVSGLLQFLGKQTTSQIADENQTAENDDVALDFLDSL
jgi:hypothetical protein